MPFTNTAAAAYGLLAMHAMDMYQADTTTLTPQPTPGLTAAGWTIEAYIIGEDTLLREGPLQFHLDGRRINYGYLAIKDPASGSR